MGDLRRQPVEQARRPDEYLPPAKVCGGTHDPVARGRTQLDYKARSLPTIRLDCQKAAPGSRITASKGETPRPDDRTPCKPAQRHRREQFIQASEGSVAHRSSLSASRDPTASPG